MEALFHLVIPSLEFAVDNVAVRPLNAATLSSNAAAESASTESASTACLTARFDRARIATGQGT
jgi:hypothetical protein